MQYFYPGDWVESGQGTDVNQFLSEIDKEFLKKTYPPGGPQEPEVEDYTVDSTPVDTDPDKVRTWLIVIVSVLLFGILIAGSVFIWAATHCKKKLKLFSKYDSLKGRKAPSGKKAPF
jgi:hypothetical protein